jgi:hypothetical protein
MKRTSLAILMLGGGMMAYANVIPYTDPAGQAVNPAYPDNLALTFNVLSPITVVGLGVFNASGSGIITGSIQVAIYDTDSNTLATPVVTFSGAYTPVGFDVFQAITPVLLGVGSYEIDAVGFNPADPNGNLTAGSSSGPILNDDGGALAFTGAAFDESGALDEPSPASCVGCEPLPAQESQFDAGSFEIGEAPEPGLFGVLAASLAGVLFAARRRRTAS